MKSAFIRKVGVSVCAHTANETILKHILVSLKQVHLFTGGIPCLENKSVSFVERGF